MPLSELMSFGSAREKWSEAVHAPVAFVVDISKLTMRDGTGRHRSVFADHMQRFEPFETRYTCAVGIVAESAVTRSIVTGLFWLQRPTFAYAVVPTVDDAVVFAGARLRIAANR